MKYLDTYEELNCNIIHIFDLDDTLLETPDFNKLAIEYLKESETIEDILFKSVNKIGVTIDNLKWENGKIFVEDPDLKINLDGNWVRRGKRIYLIPPHRWSFLDISLPIKLKELSQKYKRVKNKAIITARPEEMRSKIIEKMNEFGLEMPNYGLFMFPTSVGAGNPGEWKAGQIREIVEEHGFKTVYFYDDNAKTIAKSRKLLADLPIKFTAIRV